MVSGKIVNEKETETIQETKKEHLKMAHNPFICCNLLGKRRIKTWALCV